MEQGIMYIVAGIIMIAAFCLGKFVFPATQGAVNSVLNLLSSYPMLLKWGISACQYIAQYFTDISGEEKNKKAAEIIMQVATEVGIVITEEQARAIAQAAYESLKQGVEESEKEGDDDSKGVEVNA